MTPIVNSGIKSIQTTAGTEFFWNPQQIAVIYTKNARHGNSQFTAYPFLNYLVQHGWFIANFPAFNN